MQSFEQKTHDHLNKQFQENAYKDEMNLSQFSFAESLHTSPLEIVENEQNISTNLPDLVKNKEEKNEVNENAINALAVLTNVAQNAQENVQQTVHNYSKKQAFRQYNKQLVQTRLVMYHQQNLRMVAENVIKNPEEQRLFVIRRVARELWTNFCVKGQESPMLQYLHDKLREQYNEDFEFSYKPGTTDLIIMRKQDNEFEAVSKDEKVEIVNTAWKLAQEIVAKYTA